MIEITKKVRPAEGVAITGTLSLPWELRQKRWLRAQLLSGEAVALKLPRGESLKAGDLLATVDGRAIEVVAAPEDVLHVESASSQELARAAYHLGNRHAAVQVGQGFLRIVENAVLERLLCGLGARVSRIKAPFEPESGAYGSSHDHPSAEPGMIARTADAPRGDANDR